MDIQRRNALADAYRRTRYRAEIDGHRVDIRVDRTNPTLDTQLARHRSWAFITAHNPRSELQTTAQNQAADRRLQEHLDTRGYQRWRCDAIDTSTDKQPWPIERGWIVCDIERHEAITLAGAFEQNAILFGTVGSTAELVFVA